VAAFVAKTTGQQAAFTIAAAVVIVWSITRPIFHYSDTWQRNAFIGIEHLTEAEIEELRKKSEMRAKTKASRTERGP
jgi:low affinity Fe/Cu permease